MRRGSLSDRIDGGARQGRWYWLLHPALALVAGALHTASFSPSPAWWLQPLALAWLVAACDGVRPRRAALAGALFGIG